MLVFTPVKHDNTWDIINKYIQCSFNKKHVNT